MRHHGRGMRPQRALAAFALAALLPLTLEAQSGAQTRSTLPPVQTEAGTSIGKRMPTAPAQTIGESKSQLSRAGGAASLPATVGANTAKPRLTLDPSVFAASRVSAAATGAAFDYSGSYAISGRGDDGSAYTGTVVVSKIGGDIYRGSVHIGSNVFVSTGLVDLGGAFCIAWAARASDANIVVYDAVPGGVLEGVWFGSGDTKLATELATPTPGQATRWSITGTNPDNSHYSGRLDLQPERIHWSELTAVRLAWVIGGAPSSGIALKLGNLVAGAFPGTGTDFGTLLMLPDPKTHEFNGRWLQSINGALTSGSEIWTRSR